jgi:hypothetical protein
MGERYLSTLLSSVRTSFINLGKVEVDGKKVSEVGKS